MPISIFLVEDNLTVRKGIRQFLEEQDGFQVMGEACGVVDSLGLLTQLVPDIVLLDWGLPDGSGLDVLQHLSKRSFSGHCIVLSMHADEAYISSAFQNGAYGYVLKENIVNQLPKAIRCVAAGERYLNSPDYSQAFGEITWRFTDHLSS